MRDWLSSQARQAGAPMIKTSAWGEAGLMNGNLSLASQLVEDSPIPATPGLEAALNRVEYYQPLYGITGFEDPLRGCRDRAKVIASALPFTQSDFRLIDFGSSLGYFPFFFADRGAVTTGCDIKAANTAVAVETQRLNGLNATFKTASLDVETVSGILPGDYDVALILSVLHHITHRHGVDYVAHLLAELMVRVPVLVLELAHRNEGVNYPWRKSLPADPLTILREVGAVNVKLLGDFPSHLSAATRPMYLITR
jgi:hypothetical protein